MSAPARLEALRRHRALDPLFRTPPGIKGWFSAVNHNDIGLRYIVTAFAFFLVAGVLAMMIRAQLATPRSAFAGPEIYNQIFTMHGTIMMFLFAIPMIDGLAIYFLPKFLGARDLAFPRLGAYGYWCYLLGGLIMLGALVAGIAPDGGWFMYPPLSSSAFTPGINADVWLIGITFVEVSGIAAAVELMVTVLKVRAAGMSLGRMPLFGWYVLVTAAMILIGFPPLILGSILLEVERALDWPFFDTARGGDARLWQHLFWLFGHPEVYIIFLPGAAILSTVIPVLSRTAIVGYSWIVASIVGLGFLSFGLWVHHMFTTGIPHLGLAFFSAASTLVVVPTAIQIFAWIATMASGRPELKLPMLYVLGFFGVFVLGGLTGVMVGIVPFDWQAHDTYFVVAHLHYVLVGGFVFPLLAGAYYWLPLVTGRERIYSLGETAFWLIFIGFHLTFFLMHLTGLLGMPRRVFSYPDAAGWTWLNLLSSVGGFMTAIGFALFAVDIWLNLAVGARAKRNPWAAGTLEWATLSKPPSYNFASLPTVAGRDPLAADPELPRRLARGEGLLAEVRHGWRETLGVAMTSGRPDQVLLLPGPTLIPVAMAVPTGLFFVGLLVKLYLLALLGLAGMLAIGLWWAWRNGDVADSGPVAIGNGERVPTHHEAEEPPALWGMAFTLAADLSLFASLLFGFVFLATVAAGWPPPTLPSPSLWAAAAGLAGLAAAGLCSSRTVAAVRAGALATARRWLLLTAAGQAAGLAASAHLLLLMSPAASSHAYLAVLAVMAGYAVLHTVLGVVMALFSHARIGRGYASRTRALGVRAGHLWQVYAAATGALTLLASLLPPLLAR